MATLDNFASVQHLLSQLECFACSCKIEKISPITDGLSSQVYLILTNNGHFVAKKITGRSSGQAEALATRCASELELAAKVVCTDKDWLITEFLAGEQLNSNFSDKVILEDKLTATLALLAKLHCRYDSFVKDNKFDNVQPTIKPLNFEQVIDDLVAQVTLSNQWLTLVKSFSKNTIQQLANMQSHKNVLCHGDANFSNVIVKAQDQFTKPKTWLIDFEAACFAEIEYDIAMCLSVNNIAINRQNFALNVYQDAWLNHAGETVNLSFEKVTRYRYLSLIINGLWYLSQYQIKITETSIFTEKTSVETYKTLALEQFKLLDFATNQQYLFVNQMR